MFLRAMTIALSIVMYVCIEASDSDPEHFVTIPIDENNIQTLPLHEVVGQQNPDYATIPSNTPRQESRTIGTRHTTTGTGLGCIVGGVSGGAIGNAIAPTLYATVLGGFTGFFLGGVAGGFLSAYLFKAYYNGPCWCRSNQ